jgi:uncharacterized protein
MKIIIKFLVISLFFGVNLSAQNSTESRKFIEVTGSAEKIVKPDEIELEVVLIEYIKDGQTIKLDKIEQEFRAVLKKNNIDTGTLNLNGLDTYNWWYSWNNRNKSLKTKSFRLSLKGDVNFLKFTEDLNKKWVESISITDKKNINVQDHRREVKIQAIKAAKEKAAYLLESIGEHLGGVLSVEEISEGTNAWDLNRNLLLSNSILNSNSSGTEEINNVSSIKVRYEIKVKFEIK